MPGYWKFMITACAVLLALFGLLFIPPLYTLLAVIFLGAGGLVFLLRSRMK